jgi:hypothetical protein
MSEEEQEQTDEVEKLPVDEEIPEDHDDREAELKYEEDPNKVEEEEAEE